MTVCERHRRKTMRNTKYVTSILTVLFCCMAATAGYAQDNATPTVQPDNTEINIRDRNADEATADQQQENEADRNLTQMIRKSVMEDESLSSYAHNIKIISQDGVVTLKGPVMSEHEKRVILEKSVAVTGNADKVIDQISIKY